MNNGPDNAGFLMEGDADMKHSERMDRRKQLQLEYVEKEQPMGVYRIVNRANGKVLVGSSPNLNAVWNRHRFQLEMGVHRCKTLQADWAAFGEDAFSFEILALLKPREGEPPSKVRYDKELAELEELWIEELLPYRDKVYK